MNKDITKILEELYMLDPELKKHELEITKIVNQMIEKKPDTKFDNQFATKLRKEILKHLPKKENFWQKINWPAISLPALGTVALVILAVILPKEIIKLNNTKNYNTGFTQEIHNAGKQAFGSLSFQNNEVLSSSQRTASGEAVGLGGGGMTPMANADTIDKISISMPYQPINYEYQYVGGEIVIPDTELMVYKKEKGQNVGANVAKILSGFDFNLIGLNKFSDSQIDNMVLSENREFGYTVYFNLLDNLVNINSNWRTWPQVGRECEEQSCWEKYNLTQKDLLSDEELIRIADEFIKKYDLNMNSYGSGQINQIQRFYAMSEEEKNYIPEIYNVIYPLKINNLYVYETSGEAAGLLVNINIRYKKVSDVNNIMPANYLSSKYELETDTSKLIKRAESGGFYPAWKNEQASKTVTIKLGDPQVALIKYYQYDQNKNESYELYVPGLIFPVINNNDEYVYQKSVTVPLVKEILESTDYDINILEKNIPRAEPILY